MKRADQNHRGTASSQKELLSSRAAVTTPPTVTPSTVTGSPGSDSGTTLVGDGGATPVDTGPALGMGGPMLARTSSSPTPLGSGPGVVSAQKGGTQLTARGGGSMNLCRIASDKKTGWEEFPGFRKSFGRVVASLLLEFR